MTDSPALWCWIDCETTGLLDSRPAVLEAAWMIVRSDDLAQMTPLRQRLCAISCVPSGWECLAQAVTFWRPQVLDSWPADLMDTAVQEMHRESGLQEDWEDDLRRIGSIGELDDLIWQDVVAARESIPVEGTVPLHMAGAGVARFEMNLLPMLGSSLPERYNYGPVDTTTAARALGVPKVTEPEVLDGLNLDIQQGVTITRAITSPHRAATDVRAAYRQVKDMRTSRLVPVDETEDAW